VAEAEMLRTFNCGIGMVLVTEPARCEEVAAVLRREGEQVVRLGSVVAASGDQPGVAFDGALGLD
jgi:phosphoribosylformylglycinamidine cyclo-ligase